ncbi:MAG: phenylacetate--CoA ligase family protein, partial [Carboxydocellales bacterium]
MFAIDKFRSQELELAELQLARLQTTVARLYVRSPFYRRKLDQAGVRPEHIRTLEDISLLPFTDKEDLRENYPFGLMAAPEEDVVRIHASSGTTGKKTVTCYTRRDIDDWARRMARCLTM